MDRRNYLAAIGTAAFGAAAGCMDQNSESDNTVEYEASIEASEPLNFSVDVVNGYRGKKDRPLTLEITIENPTDQEISYGDRRDARFVNSYDEYETFVLLTQKYSGRMQDEGTERVSYDGECWVLDEEILTTDDFRSETLESGEIATATVELFSLYECSDDSSTNFFGRHGAPVEPEHTVIKFSEQYTTEYEDALYPIELTIEPVEDSE